MTLVAWWIMCTATGVTMFGYDEPSYEVLARQDEYEIRRYAPYLVAETVVVDGGDYRSSNNQAFRRLFGYISGENRRAVSMDSAVQVTRKTSEKIQMTVPVFSNRSADESQSTTSQTMQFVMPSSYTLSSLPSPLDERIVLKQVPERVVAVLRFSGSSRQTHFKKQEAKLLAALARDEVKALADPEYAQYNGPFTPAFRRRNEIVVAVDWTQAAVFAADAR